MVQSRRRGIQGPDPRDLRARRQPLLRHLAAVGRRGDRSGATPRRARPRARRGARSADPADAEVRRVQDVSPAAAKLSPFSRLVLWLLLALYRRQHWEIAGHPPAVRKFVVIGAPHTSNWDFVVFLGVTRALGIRARFLGKHTLFRWPLARFMREMGGIPVNRRAPGGNYVDQVVA